MQEDNRPIRNSGFLSDEALSNLDDDLLGWTEIAERIVFAVKSGIGKRGFAIGIKGKWGSGKTTLLNAVRSSLAASDDVLLFTYNPWSYPDEDHVRTFFAELAGYLRCGTPDSTLKKLASYVEEYTAYLGALSSASLKIARGVLLTSILVAGGGSILTLFTAVSQWVIFSIFLMLVALNVLPVIGHGLAKGLHARGQRTRGTLQEIKTAIDSELRRLGRHLVVLMDDIDRLPPKEICQVFQIIKNNGDLTNVTYVLAFDEEVVRDVLKAQYGNLYESFGEKVVQVDFGVPSADTGVLDEFYKAELDKVLQTLPKPAIQQWTDQSDRWSYLFYYFFRHTYHTFRDIKRAINGFRLVVRVVCGVNVSEVNLLDLLAIETLRIRYPTFYGFVRDNKRVFVHLPALNDPFGGEDERGEDLSKRFEWAVERLDTENDRLLVRTVCEELFPRLRSLGTQEYGTELNEKQWQAASRIAAAEVFDRYFIYGNVLDDISNNLIHSVIAAISDPKRAIAYLEPLHYTRKMNSATELVITALGEQDTGPIKTGDGLGFLMEVADYFPPPSRSATDVPLEWLVQSLADELLKSLEPQPRENLTVDTIRRSTGILGPLCLLSATDPERDPKSSWGIGPIGANNWRKLRSVLVRRGLDFVTSPRCLENRNLLTILYKLRHYAGEDMLRRKLELLIRDDEQFLQFLPHFLRKRTEVKYRRPEERISLAFDFKALGQFLDLEEVADRIMATVIPDGIQPVVKKSVELFKKTYRTYKENGPDPDSDVVWVLS